MWELFVSVCLPLALLMGYLGGRIGRASPAAGARADAAEEGVIRAKRFELVDDAGKTRGELSMSREGNPGLLLYDAAEKLRGAFSLLNGEPFLSLFDAAGKQRGRFGLVKNGEPSLGLYNTTGKAIWSAP